MSDTARPGLDGATPSDNRVSAGAAALPSIPDLDRRALLGGMASAGALALLGPAAVAPVASAAPAITVDTFANLAWGLTGYVVPDRQALRDLFAAVTRQVGGPTLARLGEVVATTEPAALDQAIRAAGLDAAAQAVARALYTGVVQGPDGPRVITYSAALVWQACDFTKPPA